MENERIIWRCANLEIWKCANLKMKENLNGLKPIFKSPN